jgi:uncharacterized protein (TIGR02466 family)
MSDTLFNGVFAVPVLQKRIPKADKINKGILDNLDTFIKNNKNKKPINWCCELYVSGVGENIIDHPNFLPLKDPVLSIANEFCDLLEYDTVNYKLKIRDSWLNAYSAGHSQETHNHPNSDISAIYYPCASKEDGPLVFKSPFHDNMRCTPILKQNERNLTQMFVRPVESALVMFPSYLLHSVMPNKSERRVSIAFNFVLESN